MTEYYSIQSSQDVIEHYGIKGMHWGIRSRHKDLRDSYKSYKESKSHAKKLSDSLFTNNKKNKLAFMSTSHFAASDHALYKHKLYNHLLKEKEENYKRVGLKPRRKTVRKLQNKSDEYNRKYVGYRNTARKYYDLYKKEK